VDIYRIDFYCPEAHLGIEFDGEQHDAVRDADRDKAIADAGITVLRIPNRSFFLLDRDNLSTRWLDTIVQECEQRCNRSAFA
jgi:very-short-patch-repair endonuclease